VVQFDFGQAVAKVWHCSLQQIAGTTTTEYAKIGFLYGVREPEEENKPDGSKA
jgi:hypothetical protein